MKLLFVTGNLNAVGGIQEYNRNFLRALKELKVSFRVLELLSQSVSSKLLLAFRFFVVSVAYAPDIVVFFHINFHSLATAARVLGKRYTVNVYGIDVLSLQRGAKKVLEKATRVVSISQFTRQKIVEQVPAAAENITILPPCVDGERFYPKEKRKDLIARYKLEDKKVILTVARFARSEKYKGYDVVLNALPNIVEAIPSAVYLLVGGGDDRDRVKQFIKERKLENYVILTGIVSDDDLVDFYNLCDVFIMPSKGEGFGIVFLEALACGKPVIVGSIDASREAILEGRLGLVVDPDDVSAISNAIVSVLNKTINPKLLDGESLRQEVLESFGFDSFVEKVRELLYKTNYGDKIY